MMSNAPTDEVGAFVFRHYRALTRVDSFPS